MKTKIPLFISLGIMTAMIMFAIIIPDRFIATLNKPAIYEHARFIHILSVGLFFANAVFGMLWESRSISTGDARVILYTYRTVIWLDALISSPLIIISVLSGITLTARWGNIWQTGWLSYAFLIFIFSGVIWILLDIPTQYQFKKMLKTVDLNSSVLPAELFRLYKKRQAVSLVGTIPLLLVFALMVYKPYIPSIANILSKLN